MDRAFDPGRIDIVNPATEQVMARVAEAREADMDKAVAAARKAFDEGPWPRMTHVERGAVVEKLAGLLERAHAPKLTRAWTEQMGGLASFAPMVVGGGVFQLQYFAGLAGTYPFETRQPISMGPGTPSSCANRWASSRRSRRGTRRTPS